MARTIALLSDFGLDDPYVGQMKAVIEQNAPKTTVIDISHGIEPFNIIQGSYFLACSYKYFPKGTIFVSVVDPGVGTDRKVVLIDKFNMLFLAPDNGLADLILNSPPACRVYDLTRAGKKLEPASTFHGRDVFAPFAARLAAGATPHEMGPKIDISELTFVNWSKPEFANDQLTATVLHTDRFGNMVLNLKIDQWSGLLEEWGGAKLSMKSSPCLAMAQTYADLPQGKAGLIASSQGYYEIAYNRTSAAKNLGLAIGDQIAMGPCR